MDEIYESDVQDFFFEKLIAAGLAPDGGDIEVISSIVFDYLVHIGILDPNNIEFDDGSFED